MSCCTLDDSSVLDLLDDGVITRDLGGLVTGWNRAAERIYGVAREDALGRSMAVLFGETAFDPLLHSDAELMAAGTWSATFLRRARGASTSVPVSTRLKLQRNDDRTPFALVEFSRPAAVTERPGDKDDLHRLLAAAGVAVVSVDATEVAGMLAALGADRRSDLREHLRNEPDLVAQMMRVARVAEAERSAEGSRAAALSAFGPAGSSLAFFWPQESADAFVDTVVSVLVDNRPAQSACRLLRDGTTTFDADVTAVPASADGSGVRILLAVRDVSADREAFAALEASERRYRHLFEYMPIALAEVDASGLVEMFGALRRQGVTDLSTYIDAHPEFLDAAMGAMLVEQVNQTTADLFGAKLREDMNGDLTRYWDAGLPTLRKSLEARYRGESFFQGEAQLRRLDGDVVDVLFATARHGHLQSKSLAAFVDFTDRKRSDKALRRSERRYQDLFQAMTVSFWELDLTAINDLLEASGPPTDGDFAIYLQNYPDCVATILKAAQIVDVNDQTLTLFGGTDKSDLLGTLDHFWSPDRWIDGAAAVLTVLVNEASVTIETRLRRLDGAEFDAQFTLWISTDDRRRGLAAVTDISERVNAFNQMEQSEQRFRDLFQHVPVPVLQVNSTGLLTCLQELKDQGVGDLGAYMVEHPDLVWTAMDNTVIEQANDAALKVLGAADADEVRGPITPLWRDHPEVYARLLQNRYSDVSTYEEEVTLTTFDGRTREGMLTVSFPPALARLGVTINAFVDTTEKKQAERRLRQIEADYAHAARISMLGELTASIAHEVNQPLAAITTYGEAGLRWLSRPTPALSEVREIVTRIVADAQRAASVIARVRTMASRRIHEEIVSLDDLVAEAVLFLKHEFQAHDVKVAHQPLDGSARIAVDRIQLQQVIVNMAVNAVQAISATNSPRREVLIRIADEDVHVRCSVEDSGPGICVDGTSRIFDSFFTTKDGGMGMGLPISRSIIEAHGGRMVADNESSLGGARFSFVLPVVQ